MSRGPPKVDILPSTRKRISSGRVGNGETAAIFFGSFARDFRCEAFAGFEARRFCGERLVAVLPDFGLRLGGGIRLYLIMARPCLWYIQGFPERRGRVRVTHGALDQWCPLPGNTRHGYL